MAIQSFGTLLTEKIYRGVKDKEVAKFPSDVQPAAKRKLDMLHAAAVLQELASPPGNKLHALKDDLAGYHAICINEQWRLIFRWGDKGPEGVEIRDYH